jgi:CRP-like cAMP-binding protein
MDFESDTWVVRSNLQDSGSLKKYISAIYWAITTAATVGYGDIVPLTPLETFLTITWMVIGVGFYSFTVGSLSSFLTSIDTRDSLLSMKMAAVQEFARQVGISQEAKIKIREAIKYNAYRMGSIWSDKHALFNELPKALRQEVAWSMYNGVARDFPVLRLFESSLVSAMMPHFKPLKQNEGEYLYAEGDYPDQVFFITLGRVNFVIMPREISYKSFLKGSYIGEVEIVKHISRTNTAVCCGICEFLILSKYDFNKILEDFPSEAKLFRKIALEKATRNKQAYLETIELLKLKAAYGSLEDLAGQSRIIKVECENDAEENVMDQVSGRVKQVEESLGENRNGLEELSRLVNETNMLVTEALERLGTNRL